MDNADTNIFPSIPRSVLYQPSQPMSTAIASQLSLRSALPDLENPFGDAPFEAHSTSQTNIGSSQWSVPTGANGLPTTYQHQPSAASPRPTSTGSQGNSLGSLYQSLPKDARIGIIVCIVVIVALSLLGCGMCFLDCRRRQRRRKERQERRDTELMILETEMRSGQLEQQRRARRGLWDHLKPASGTEGSNVVGIAREDARQHGRIRSDALDARKDSTITSTRSESVSG